MSAAEQRQWFDTPAGVLHQAMGTNPFATDHQAVEAAVDETRKFWRETYGKELDERQVASARVSAELRFGRTEAGQLPSDSYELAAAVKRANPGKRAWTVTPTGEHGSGIATRMNGQWTADSDPAIAAAVEAAEEAKFAQQDEAYTAWRRSAGKSIGPPT